MESRTWFVAISPESGRAYGIVIATDVYDKIVAQDRKPSLCRAAEIMTSPIECAEVGWILRQASELMQQRSVHHLPVEDERAAMVGVISATDISVAVDETSRYGGCDFRDRHLCCC